MVCKEWEGDMLDSGHQEPDNTMGTKLKWLKNLRQHLGLSEKANVWIWWDVLCLPMHDRTLEIYGLLSLPYYVQTCRHFIPLVRSSQRWKELYGETASMLPLGTLSSYLNNGWCRLHCQLALCPKNRRGVWMQSPANMRFRFHECEFGGVGPPVTVDLLHGQDPLDGEARYMCCDRFLDETHDCDRSIVADILRVSYRNFLKYNKSASFEWALVPKGYVPVGKSSIGVLREDGEHPDADRARRQKKRQPGPREHHTPITANHLQTDHIQLTQLASDSEMSESVSTSPTAQQGSPVQLGAVKAKLRLASLRHAATAGRACLTTSVPVIIDDVIDDFELVDVHRALHDAGLLRLYDTQI